MAVVPLALPTIVEAIASRPSTPQLTILVGGRKVGKSSLARRLAQPSLYEPATCILDVQAFERDRVILDVYKAGWPPAKGPAVTNFGGLVDELHTALRLGYRVVLAMPGIGFYVVSDKFTHNSRVWQVVACGRQDDHRWWDCIQLCPSSGDSTSWVKFTVVGPLNDTLTAGGPPCLPSLVDA
jgi:hypothetical protein